MKAYVLPLDVVPVDIYSDNSLCITATEITHDWDLARNITFLTRLSLLVELAEHPTVQLLCGEGVGRPLGILQ